MPPVVQIQVQRTAGDCTICALSMYLGRGYEDVLGAAVASTNSARVHHNGMFTRDMKSTAKRLGVILDLCRGFDVDNDEGVLSLTDAEKNQHAVLLKSGLIFDGDGTVWEPQTYFSHYHYRPISLLVRREDRC